jgi:hypothetical protein
MLKIRQALQGLSSKQWDKLDQQELIELFQKEKTERANKLNPRSQKEKYNLIKDDWKRVKKQKKENGIIVDGDKNEFSGAMDYIKCLASGLSPTSKASLKEWFGTKYYNPKQKAPSVSAE